MLTALQFYRTICKHLKRLKGRDRNFFMHEEKERWRQNRGYQPQYMREVQYKGRTLAVQVFCDPVTGKGNVYVQVLSGPGAASTNTQHVTLTNRNVRASLYFVRPSLMRCRSRLIKAPSRIRGYPRLAPGTTNQYIVGAMNTSLLKRVFEVAIAKYDCM